MWLIIGKRGTYFNFQRLDDKNWNVYQHGVIEVPRIRPMNQTKLSRGKFLCLINFLSRNFVPTVYPISPRRDDVHTKKNSSVFSLGTTTPFEVSSRETIR
jgi:hypothetical protein